MSAALSQREGLQLSFTETYHRIDVVSNQIKAAHGAGAKLLMLLNAAIPGGHIAEQLATDESMQFAVPVVIEPRTENVPERLRVYDFVQPDLIEGWPVVIIGKTWGSGEGMSALRARVHGMGARVTETAVLSFDPNQVIDQPECPTYYQKTPTYCGGIDNGDVSFSWRPSDLYQPTVRHLMAVADRLPVVPATL